MTAPGGSYGPLPPHAVPHPVMRHDWLQLTFVHWRYDAGAVQRLLPPGLTVQEYDGSAWVGLVPFVMRVKPPAGPPVPWLSTFCETNVRTYATGPGGRTGVWFLSLDAARLGAVTVARAAYGLPYFWSRMRAVPLRADGDGTDGAPEEVLYLSGRHRSGRHRSGRHRSGRHLSPRTPQRTASSLVQVRPGPAYRADELAELDHFLTARFALWAYRLGRLRWTPAEHPPWPLRRAELLRADDALLRAAGLPAPTGEPVAHYSNGVTVRIGRSIRLE